MDVGSPNTVSGSSRDPTPSSSSSQPTLPNTAESVTTVGSGPGGEEENVERFLKKMEMEKKMRRLQQRLELASVSVKHSQGVRDQSFDEFDQHLPSSPTIRKRKSQLSLQPQASCSSSTSPRTLRSPSALHFRSPRPRSLYDSLVEPLPPPSHASPISPRKRTRTAGSESASPAQHRRASASMSFLQADPYASPRQVDRARDGDMRLKRRSQSHSHARRLAEPELDAAKALTSMLGSGSGSAIANDTNSDTDDDGRDRKRFSIPIAASRSYPDIKPRAQSFAYQASPLAPSPSFNSPGGGHLRTPSSHDRHRVQEDAELDEDKKAAELMIFLAHSPSPMRKTPVSQAMAPGRMTGARVLFADGGSEPPGKSALAHEVVPGEVLGSWLGPERS